MVPREQVADVEVVVFVEGGGRWRRPCLRHRRTFRRGGDLIDDAFVAGGDVEVAVGVEGEPVAFMMSERKGWAPLSRGSMR
jgi:hypothetical protein